MKNNTNWTQAKPTGKSTKFIFIVFAVIGLAVGLIALVAGFFS